MNFLKKHQEQIMPIIMAMLALCIVGYFVWGVQILNDSISKGLSPATSTNSDSSFNLKQAQKINFKGLTP